MTVYIHQADAFARLTQVEGENWAKEQLRRPASPYGFQAWLDAWARKQAAGDQVDVEGPLSDFMEGGDGAIYGEGGYARYQVAADGELVLLGWSVRDEKKALATAQGFRVC